MGDDALKADLLQYLQRARDAVVWKLEGLSEYDVRRPRTPTGTNLLGLVKHLSGVEVGYFGDTFGRPFTEPLPWWSTDAGPEADLWATPEESRAHVLDLYARANRHADATVEALPLDAVGTVPWWPTEHATVTLHRLLVHVVAETERHAGHADVVRELLDGAAGLRPGRTNLPDVDAAYWRQHVERVEQAARQAQRDADQHRDAGTQDGATQQGETQQPSET